MISPPSAASFLRPRRVRPGFSLIELLVVIGIIIILASITLVIVNKARKSANATRVKADFQSISMALEQYKADFTNYPATGAANLCQALIGPADESVDGVNGPGFRNTPGGKKYDSYLPAGKFKTSGSGSNWVILDPWDRRIEYALKSTTANAAVNAAALYPGTALDALYLAKLLGDDDLNGKIDAGETLRFDGPFLLASSGPDQVFVFGASFSSAADARAKVTSSDDIFNFDR